MFESYSTGNQTDNSGIALLVDSRLKGLSFYRLLEDVAEVLNTDVDLIDISQVIPEIKVDWEIKKMEC